MAVIALKHADSKGAHDANETSSIPLNKLVPWDGKVRRTKAEEGLEELIASIAAHGVLQSLVVRKASRGNISSSRDADDSSRSRRLPRREAARRR
jgi:hypothetical protein